MENLSVMDFLLNPTVIVTIFIGASALLLVYILRLFKIEHVAEEKNQSETISSSHSERKKESSSGKSKKKSSGDHRWSTRTDKQGFTSPWLLKTLKSHTGQVLNIDYSSSGKYLASCGEEDPDPDPDLDMNTSSGSECNKENSRPPSADPSPRTKGLSRRQRKNRRREDSSPDNRAVLLWDSKDLTQKDNKSLRINIEFDHPTFVKWSPDSKAFIIHKFNENAIEVYKIEKKKDGWLGHATKALTFPKVHETDVIGMGISSNGKFIMSCSNKTDLVVWDLKGQKLGQIDTYLMSTTCAKISPCGRFIVASGFAPDAKVWEVIFSKAGEFQEIKRVFELTGHSSGVYDVAFDVDSSHMATVSKDGTWKLFDTKIEYKKGETPHLKITGKYQQAGNHSLIALSPNAEVVVIATGNSLAFYSTLTGHLDYTIDNIYSGRITSILFDAMGKYVLTTGDKYIRIFHNVTGYRCNIVTAKDKLKQHQTSATKERLEKLIEDCETFLNSIEKK